MEFLEVLWTVFVIYALIFLLFTLFRVVVDLFRDHEMSGVAKAGWLIVLVVLPIIGLLAYLIARGPRTAERDANASRAARAAFNGYGKDVAGAGGPAQEIAAAKALRDSGTINQAEFGALEAKALA